MILSIGVSSAAPGGSLCSGSRAVLGPFLPPQEVPNRPRQTLGALPPPGLVGKEMAKESPPAGKRAPRATGNLRRSELLEGCWFRRCAGLGVWEYADALHTESLSKRGARPLIGPGDCGYFWITRRPQQELVMCEQYSPG